jgi:hypothetical protein
LSEIAHPRSRDVSSWWLVLLLVFLVLEIAFLAGAYSSSLAGLEKVFGVFTGLILVAFGAILYAGRLVFYD